MLTIRCVSYGIEIMKKKFSRSHGTNLFHACCFGRKANIFTLFYGTMRRKNLCEMAYQPRQNIFSCLWAIFPGHFVKDKCSSACSSP